MGDGLDVLKVEQSTDHNHGLGVVMCKRPDFQIVFVEALSFLEVQPKHDSEDCGCQLENPGVNADNPFVRVGRQHENDVAISSNFHNVVVIQTEVVMHDKRCALCRKGVMVGQEKRVISTATLFPIRLTLCYGGYEGLV